MIADLKPDDSVAIQQNSDDVNLPISYDIKSARNMYASSAGSCLKSVYCLLRGWLVCGLFIRGILVHLIHVIRQHVYILHIAGTS